MLKIFNSLTGQKEEFKPIKPPTKSARGTVGLYVCGMTVYDFCHIGHARVMIVFDMVVRYLRSLHYPVHYVRNITDIDDKIIQRAREQNIPISELTTRFIKEMNTDAAALGILTPTKQPRATEHIPQIISMIGRLLEKKYAYIAANGDVFYKVSAFKDYGKLSGRKIDELRAGSRVAIQEAKTDPLDFVLWKARPSDEAGDEAIWESPWGYGRPGWHIECSAMSMLHLGECFDIHGGGHDLQFPHHENEIAQAEGVTGKPFVKFWMHNGFVKVDEEKMSKSLGNFFTVREVLKKYHPEVVRFFILSSHYRSPLNYSTANLDEAKAALSRLYGALRAAEDGVKQYDIEQANKRSSEPPKPYGDFDLNATPLSDDQFYAEFHAYMDDDFHTPKAISVLHELAHQLNQCADKNTKESADFASMLQRLGKILGLLQLSPQEFFQAKTDSTNDGLDDAAIQQMIDERQQAKASKDYAKSDQIRDRLLANKIKLEDTAEETIWRRL